MGHVVCCGGQPYCKCVLVTHGSSKTKSTFSEAGGTGRRFDLKTRSLL